MKRPCPFFDRNFVCIRIVAYMPTNSPPANATNKGIEVRFGLSILLDLLRFLQHFLTSMNTLPHLPKSIIKGSLNLSDNKE